MKVRVITAAVLLPLLLLIVLVLPQVYTAVLFGLMASIGAFELLNGTGFVKHTRLCVYSMVMAFWCVLWCGLGLNYAWLLLGILVFGAVLFAELMIDGMKLPFDNLALCFTAAVVIPLMMFGSVVRIHNIGIYLGRFYIMVPFVLAFLSDTGAYFAGRFFGKHKLAPTISPKKTVEGVIGGVLGAIVGMLLYCLVLDWGFDFRVRYGVAVIYGILGSAAAVFGDLCFSAIKRQTGIKDYGNLFPGHGGILDRFDSMFMVGPLTEILLILLAVAVK